jgi:hypothetical protein
MGEVTAGMHHRINREKSAIILRRLLKIKEVLLSKSINFVWSDAEVQRNIMLVRQNLTFRLIEA